MIDLNLNSLKVDEQTGRVSFSGLSSGIDFKAAVDAIIEARRIPVDTLETRITENEEKIASLNDLRSRLSVLRESLSKLYGRVSFGNTGDVFQAKQAFASTRRLDGGSASDATNLVGITVSNSADAASHTIELLQVATSHKISSDSVADTTTALGFADGDTFTLEGRTITVSSTDTLLDLRDRINNANTGASATGVTASVVTVSASEHYLLLTKDETGQSITIADGTGAPLNAIGVLNGGAIKNELQAAQSAKFYVDGLIDQTNTIYESSFQTSGAVTLGSAGTLDFTRDSDGFALGSVVYAAGDSLQDLAANINANVTDVTAAVVSDGNGVRLEISGVSAFSMAESGGGTVLADLGINNKRLEVTRASNTVSDLFDGVTLSLFQAEQGTTINIDIERDLNAIKSQINTFVESYNELRIFINTQRRFDQGSPIEAEDSGVLFSSRALAEVDTALGRIIGEGTLGVSNDFSVLAQIGVKFVNNNQVLDPVLSNTLKVDEAKLDEVLLNNLDDVRRLFTFDFTTSDPRVKLLGFDENTVYSETGYTLNIQPVGAVPPPPPPPPVVNQISFSEVFDDPSYTTVKATITANATTAPDGDATADALTLDGTLGLHYVETESLAVTAGQTYTYSVYVKAGSKDQVKLDMAGTGLAGTDASATFDLATGTLLDAGTDLDGATITADANGYYRISVTATADANGTVTIKNQAVDNALGETFTGDNSDALYLHGSQFEDTSAEAPTALASFTSTKATIVIDNTLAPDGTMTADEISANPANQVHDINSTDAINVTAGNQYTYVAYLKAGTQTTAQVYLSDVGGAFAAGTTANFDLAAGTVTGTGAGTDSATIEAATNGFYRVTLTATALATTGTTVASIAPNDGVAYSGTGGDLFFFEPKVVDTSTLSPTAYEQTGVSPPASPADSDIASANFDGPADGSDDGSATISGSIITSTAGGTEGLRVAADGFTAVTAVQIDYTVGVGTQLFFEIERLLDPITGAVETEIEALTDTNEFSEARVEEMLVRLDIQRQNMLDRFVRMEAALATANRILDSIRQTADALFRNQN